MTLRITAFNAGEENYTAVIQADSLKELERLQKRYPLAERISVRHERRADLPPAKGLPVLRRTWRTGNTSRARPIVALSLPIHLSRELGIEPGSEIEIQAADGCLIVRPAGEKTSA